MDYFCLIELSDRYLKLSDRIIPILYIHGSAVKSFYKKYFI